jgi:hypothetical protein
MIARSTDAGQTWSAPEILNPYHAVDGGGKDLYPKLATDGHGNWATIWEIYNHAIFPAWGFDHEVLFMSSNDQGVTWSDPDVVNDHATMDGMARDEDPVVVATPHGLWMTVWFSTYDLGGTIGLERDVLYATACEPTLDGDHDCDGDVDLSDFRAFQQCFSPAAPVGPECGSFDFAGDKDVDLDDYVVFEGALSGPGI